MSRPLVPVILLCFALLPVSGFADDALLNADPGPHAVTVTSDIMIVDPVQDRTISLRILAPEGAGPFPLVVFSAGAFCFPQMYDRITMHWATHGYVVILPDHLDSPNLGKIDPRNFAILDSSRTRDLSAVVDSLDTIEADIGRPGLVDVGRLAAAGHSYGGKIAMIKTGLRLTAEAYKYSGDSADARFRAAVIMSGVGMMDDMTEDAFAGLTGPLMATGGTLDLGNVGTGVIHPWEWRMSGYTESPPGDKYSVVLEEGDHYLGGLICRENRGGEADPEGVEIDRAMTATFLDAYLKGDSAALKFLENADVAALTGNRARFVRK